MKRFFLFAVVAVVIGSLVLAGCGPKETTPTSAEPEPTSTEPEPSGPVPGGILKSVIIAGPAMMSYKGQMGPQDATYVMPAVEQLVEPLVTEDGARGWEPWLCESYEIDPQGKTFTFNLREGIKFHDGSVMDAEVVKWNFVQQIESGWLQDADKVTSIETPDDSTVVIHFSEYSNQYEFNWGWTPIYSKAAWMEATGGDPDPTNEKGIDWATDHVVGTGPFVLKEYKRDVSMTWEKFDDYWREGRPYLDGLEGKIVTEATTSSSLLQAGDIDIWYQGHTAKYWDELDSKGYVVKNYWPGLPYCIYTNTKDPDTKWQDKRVREALEYAIDNEAIAKALGHGYYEPMEQLAPSTEWGYIQELDDVREYNPEKAKQLLADAGYEDGCPIKLTVLSTPGDIDAAESIKGYLDQAGFDCNLDIADPGRFYGSVFGTGWEDAVLYFYGMDVTFLSTYMSWFSTDPKSNLASFARTDYQKERDPEIVKLVSAEDQKAATEEMCRHLYEEARLCPLWKVPATTVGAPYVHYDIYKHGFIRVDWQKYWMEEH